MSTRPACRGINTNQDAFDKVWNHFITNRHGPGTGPSGDCVTYDPERPHARCALGIMATPRECQAELGLKVHHQTVPKKDYTIRTLSKKYYARVG